MAYTLIISEKPAAAKKIAEALADGKPIKENLFGVPYFKVTHGKKDIVVACAVGHLYALDQDKGNRAVFPVFDISWKEAGEVRKTAEFSSKYLKVIKKLAKDANEFVIATDLDIEGETIGFNILRFACRQKDGKRMRFSTLTKEELIKSFENRTPTIDWGLAKAGETRHFLDFYNGINYSRALTSAYKSTGGFKILSIGRVQGPALKTIVDKEKEIKAFIPVPYWQIELNGKAKQRDINAWHKEDKFWEKQKAETVMTKVKGQKEGIVSSVEKKSFKQQPPFPFDLTSMQVEAYKVHKIQPKDTLAIAQELYTAGYISYPRTSSQVLPKEIGYSKILKLLSSQPMYKELCNKLLKKPTLNPNNGSKTDPAHPAIYPTGIAPDVEGRERKIYDLIARRFMATFSDPATRETMKVDINVNEEIFIAKGTRTTEKGWFEFYGPYVMLEEEELPPVTQGEKIAVKKIQMHEKETQPPKRYTPASIIKELEKRGLGTKATRASIVDTLFQRNYVTGTKSIEATELGIRTIATLEKYVPRIIDEELTRHFEDEMELIREEKKDKDQVLDESKVAIVKIIDDFKSHEKKIGKELKAAQIETRDALTTIGKCPKCKEGDLQIRKGKFGAFVACNKYPDCKTTFSLPSNAMIKPCGKVCEICGYPMVKAIKKKSAQDFCLNPECKSKYIEGKAGKEAKAIAKGEIEKKCPTCGANLALRKSIYGSFLGCSNYPKCKYTEKLENQTPEQPKQ